MLSCLLISLLLLNTSPINIDIWVNKEDVIYYPTENLEIFFKTNQNCYIAVYDIEVGGREYRLFPPEGEDGWVKAGEIYQLPPEQADYDYVVSGDAGIETIVAVASLTKLPQLSDNDPNVVKQALEIYIQEPEPARLRIISTPKKCRIYIKETVSGDEEYIGKTPKTIVMRPGEYIVRIKKFGFKTLTRRIWLEPGDRRRVFAKLMGS